ncbi:MAG TPA: transcriptional repressor [Chloroflexota bacterium]|nr:transcriptional repressor [Chloroflexota bacterium]
MATETQRYTALAQALARKGLRLTPQREAVLRVLATTAEHPSVEQLYALARRRCRSTSRATVYNTVSMLKQLGEVVELEFAGGGNRYDARTPEPHPHLVCTRCGRIDDFDRADLRGALAVAAASSGYRVTGRRLDFYGECPACQDQADRVGPAGPARL